MCVFPAIVINVSLYVCKRSIAFCAKQHNSHNLITSREFILEVK